MGEDVTPSGSPEQALLRWLEGGGPPQSQARPSRKGVEHPAGWGLEMELARGQTLSLPPP